MKSISIRIDNANPENTKVLLDGEDVTSKMYIKEISFSVVAPHTPLVTLVCYADEILVEADVCTVEKVTIS